MTNLLKRTVEKASVVSSKSSTSKYIKMPEFKKTDKADVILRKLNDYKAKVRTQSGEVILDDVLARFEQTDSVSILTSKSLLIDQYESYIVYLINILCQRAARKDFKFEEITSLLDDSVIIKTTGLNGVPYYLGVFDDAKIKLKVKSELGYYYNQVHRGEYYYGIVSLSSLETISELGLKEPFSNTNGNSALSRQEDFQAILYGYKEEYQKLIRQDNVNSYYVKKNYFITPTEVFARGFEMWASKRIADKPSSLYKTPEELTTLEYQPYNTMFDQVIDYFDKLLEENKASDYKEYSVKLQPKDLKSVAQLSFREVEPTVGGDQRSLF